MNEKKRHIIESAIRCFSQKGYHATSIQEIADSLGIAKGSVYFYFKSKEDLLLSASKHYVDLMLRALTASAGDSVLQPRERVAGQIVDQLEMLVQYREFFLMLMNEQTLQINDEIKSFIFSVRAQTLFWYRKQILDIYGERARPYSIDAATIFSAMIGQYTQYVLLDRKDLDFHKLSRFLLDRLDDTVGGMMNKQVEPMLHESLMADFIVKGQERFDQRKNEMFEEIQSIRNTVESMQLDQGTLDEIMSSLLVLEGEMEKELPRPVVVKGMIAFLKSLKINGIKKRLAAIESGLL